MVATATPAVLNFFPLLPLLVFAIVLARSLRIWPHSIFIENDAIVAKGNSVHMVFPLADISSFAISWDHIKRKFVEVRLNRWARWNPVTGIVSTRGLGMPHPFTRKIALHPDDPEAFVAAAEPHLNAASSAQ